MDDVMDEPEQNVRVDEFSCHCCYEVLLEPTTLTCGHSFCRHCLASWWASGPRNDCPECRTPWEGFPRVNILLRDAVERLFPADVERRRRAVLSEPWIRQVLQAFRQHSRRTARPHNNNNNNINNIHNNINNIINIIENNDINMNNFNNIVNDINNNIINIMNNSVFRVFYSGVRMTIICLAVLLLLGRAFSSDSSPQMLFNKPLSRWSSDDVTLWVEHLGVWTNQYKETFRNEQTDGSATVSMSAVTLADVSQSLEHLHTLQEPSRVSSRESPLTPHTRTTHRNSVFPQAIRVMKNTLL